MISVRKIAAGIALTALFFGMVSCSEDDAVEVTASDVKARFNMLVSVFENDNPNLSYDAVNDIGDGRGFTCGWIGLVTSEPETAELIKAYTALKPDNQLKKFTSELEKLGAAGNGSTSSLTGFAEAWKTEASDPLFRKAYDAEVDDLYFNPAIEYFTEHEFSLNLTKFILFDAVIQHGDGTDPDGLAAMISRTDAKNPANEQDWCRKFLDVRYETLNNPANSETKDVWRESLPRIDVQRGLINSGNWDFNGPIEVNNDIYTHCIIN